MTPRTRSVSEEDLARLKHEREEVDERYNLALTSLDQARQTLPEIPHPPPAPDETQITPLNTRWEILEARPAFAAGLRGKLASFVWHLIEPALSSQQAFNSALVDHVNRNLPVQRETSKAIASNIAVLQHQIERLAHFQLLLLGYLQQITRYVDTKDYEFAALARRATEDVQEELDRLERTARGLAAGISGVSDEMLKRWESLLARDQRYTGRIDEVRSGLAVAQQQVMVLKREFERAATALAGAEGAMYTDRATSGDQPGGAGAGGAGTGTSSAATDS